MTIPAFGRITSTQWTTQTVGAEPAAVLRDPKKTMLLVTQSGRRHYSNGDVAMKNNKAHT